MFIKSIAHCISPAVPIRNIFTVIASSPKYAINKFFSRNKTLKYNR